MDAARVRAELSVQDLWPRYLGHTSDAFDLDGYRQGLVPLDAFQEDVLAQTVNEALTDSYEGNRIPLATPAVEDGSDEHLRSLIRHLLDEPPPTLRVGWQKLSVGWQKLSVGWQKLSVGWQKLSVGWQNCVWAGKAAQWVQTHTILCG